MIDTPRARRSLDKLVKIARADCDALRIDLADVERARRAAEESLNDLEKKASAEEAKGADAIADMAAYREGVRARRHNLKTTLMSLEDAEQNARSRLETAFLEVKKLEHLIEISDRADRKSGKVSDLKEMDEFASARARR